MKRIAIISICILAVVLFTAAYIPRLKIRASHLLVTALTEDSVLISLPKVINQGSYNRVTVDSLGRVTAGAVDTISSTNLTIAGIILGNRTINLPNIVTAGTYNRVTTDAFGRTTAGAVDSSYTITRALNSNYTISATRSASVVYSISIIGNDSAYAHLEISANGGGLWTEVCVYGTDFTNATSRTSGILMGRVPINNLVRIRTSGTGAGNITYLVGQETQL